jgi:hypothetical protein
MGYSFPGPDIPKWDCTVGLSEASYFPSWKACRASETVPLTPVMTDTFAA